MTEPEIDLVEHIEALRKSTESGVTLVTAAIIDEWLEKLLLTAMRDGLSNIVAERILGSNGPLYDLSPKIDVSYAFGLIDEPTKDSLRIIKNIRNTFAHSRAVLHFDSEPIAELCQKLPGWKKGADNSALFDLVAVRCVEEIDRKTQELVMAHALRDDA